MNRAPTNELSPSIERRFTMLMTIAVWTYVAYNSSIGLLLGVLVAAAVCATALNVVTET